MNNPNLAPQAARQPALGTSPRAKLLARASKPTREESERAPVRQAPSASDRHHTYPSSQRTAIGT